jgi:hypothetical protein
MPQIENVTQIKLRMPQGGHPNGVKHARKKGNNEGIHTALSKGIEKREKGFAGRVYTADRIPPEIRCPPPEREAGKTGYALPSRQDGKKHAGQKTAG